MAHRLLDLHIHIYICIYEQDEHVCVCVFILCIKKQRFEKQHGHLTVPHKQSRIPAVVFKTVHFGFKPVGPSSTGKSWEVLIKTKWEKHN